MIKAKNILWDFDGVLIDSMPTREYGFREIFKNFDQRLVDELIDYHCLNGGLSRFHKIKYFYNELLNQDINEYDTQHLANNFSTIMRKELTNSKYIIRDSMDFVENNYKKYNFHIVSGSEHNELNYICKELEISKYFLSINGSPTPKNTLVENLLHSKNYNSDETILIGDSINDYEAAKINKIDFFGYNNKKLKKISDYYISDFKVYL